MKTVDAILPLQLRGLVYAVKISNIGGKNMKIRFIEPANTPYKKSVRNYFVYDENIRTPSNGIITLATILKPIYDDVFCYSESISQIKWNDVLDSDIIFISIFTFNANRGYELAEYIRKNSKALIARNSKL